VKNKEVWVVGGSAGQYEDYRDWVVCFFDTEKEAKTMAEFLGQKYREYELLRGEDWDMKKYEKADKFMWKFDQFHAIGSDDSRYCHYKIERGVLPAPQPHAATKDKGE
jgi:hypothetical protein